MHETEPRGCLTLFLPWLQKFGQKKADPQSVEGEDSGSTEAPPGDEPLVPFEKPGLLTPEVKARIMARVLARIDQERNTGQTSPGPAQEQDDSESRV